MCNRLYWYTQVLTIKGFDLSRVAVYLGVEVLAHAAVLGSLCKYVTRIVGSRKNQRQHREKEIARTPANAVNQCAPLATAEDEAHATTAESFQTEHS
jgi:hypothetical protein